MITSPAFAGKRFAVLGLARSGFAAVESLLASGAQVVAWDRQDVARAKLAGRAELYDPLDLDLSGFAGVVVSPGVPLNTHPIVQHAARYDVPVIGDIELFSQARQSLPAHKIVGITGTNGKSTTTALITHIVREAGMPVRMGGNIGLPILAEDPLPPGGVYVLELSSYQIDLTRNLDCDAAVLLNITPDHLDRYDGFAGYVASKARLFDMLHTGVAVLNESDPEVHAIADRLRAEGRGELIDWQYVGDAGASGLRQSDWPGLQGPHNLENAEAAITVCEALGMEVSQIDQGLRSFRGLPHRLEVLTECNGVTFINDSKATNQASTAPALAAFPANPEPRIHWIVGGLAKEDGLGDCEQFLGNIAKAYTIGEAGPRFSELLAGKVPVQSCELLQAATQSAAAEAGPGDIVLLSPACASFDQFRDYEKRGDHFRQIVEALTGREPPASSRLEGKSAA